MERASLSPAAPARSSRKEADEADPDECGFDDTKGAIAEGDRFALPPEDREQNDGRSNVCDGGQDFQEGALRAIRVSAPSLRM
jgi:hypothetical protein